jgi:hypothetical protein
MTKRLAEDINKTISSEKNITIRKIREQQTFDHIKYHTI